MKRRATVLADALEAALGAVYYDAGLEAARAVVRRAWDGAMVAQAEPPKDAKTTLQEWAQKHTRDLPVYRVVARSGPPHAPEFAVAVQVGGVQGTGTRRQQAGRRATRGGGSAADDGPARCPAGYGRGASGCGGDPGGRSGADSDGKLMGRETPGAGQEG